MKNIAGRNTDITSTENMGFSCHVIFFKVIPELFTEQTEALIYVIKDFKINEKNQDQQQKN